MKCGGVSCLSSSVHGLCFFFKQKTAYEMRISDWSSDVCSSDLVDEVVCYDVHCSVLSDGVSAVVLGGHEQDRVDIGDGLLERARDRRIEIGRASCRERVCQYV